MIALAVIICAWGLSRDAKVYQIPAEAIYDLIFWTVAWGIIGARIFYILLTWEYFSQHPLEMVMLQQGGLSWQGGFLGGTAAGLWFVKQRKMPIRVFLDLVAPYIALGQSIGRIGCFLNGCCYGKPAAWGIYFPVHADRLHPTQLYEAAGLFIIFLLLKYASGKPHRTGMIFVLYLWLAAIERFTVEFFRADHGTWWLGLSLFQYISLGIFIAGIFLLGRFRK